MSISRRRPGAVPLLRLVVPLVLSLVALVSACGGASTPDAEGPAASREPAPPASAAPAASTPGALAVASGTPSATQPGNRAPGDDGPKQVAPPEGASFDVKIVPAAAPPFARMTKKRADAAASSGKRTLKLTKVSQAKQHPAKDEKWFEDNGIVLPAFGAWRAGLEGPKPAALPGELRGQPFFMAIRQNDGGLIALYGPPGDGGRYVVGIDASGHARFALDFAAFATVAVTEPGAERYTTQGVRWAELVDGALVVSTFHRTYAKTTGGKNAFLTALDPATGEIRWQSDPLVSNSFNFLVWDGLLVTGYGFTAEPDRLLVVDPATGATLGKTSVDTGPELLARKDGRLFVRTYDTDYVFRVE